MLPLPALAYTIVGLLLAYTLYNKLNHTHRERLFALKHGCQRLRRAPQRDKILGIDVFLRVAKATREHQSMQHISNWFSQVGSTFRFNVLGDKVIMTNEPMNVQAILVTHFSDFEIGESRSRSSAQMLGHGVFNSDGKAWERGRALIRPNFVKSQVADLNIFEKNYMALVDALPQDDTTVDIQEWIFRLVSQDHSSLGHPCV